jgi:hypothetical protein
VPWDAVTAIASVISMVAFVLTALYIRGELKAIEQDRYLAVTNQLFEIWETKEFMDAQLWLLHRLEQNTWQEFVQAHRADTGEAAFHRVGSFYDRVGTLVRLGFVNDKEILSTIGGHAIAVWRKIEPLVREARSMEHSTLFSDFERLLPSCYECYLPTLQPGTQPKPASPTPASPAPSPALPRITPAELQRRLQQGDQVILLDVRPAVQVTREPRTLPHAIVMPPDNVQDHYTELPTNQELVVYCA